MNQLTMKKITKTNASEVSKHADLEKSTLSLLTPELSTEEFVRLLLEKKLYKEVINILAQALPPREAVYWASLCAKDQLEKTPSEEDEKAIKAAERWMYKPNDEDRYINQTFAEKLEYSTSAAWVSNAIFWSGGSILPPNEPKVEPAEGLFGKAISGAVKLASVDDDPVKMEKLQKKFVARGIDVAQGGKGDKLK